jgi:hypothetical protein
MTLIISELTSYGIVMVADTTVTHTAILPSGRIERVLNGVQKLQIIPYLPAGVSMWGLGNITLSNKSTISTDIWLVDFIRRHSDLTSIQDFADALKKELQQLVGNLKEPMGFHLAGYVEVDGKQLPTLYHIRNGDGVYGYYEFSKG